ncbi:hypothetical protein VIGAN_01301500 [Vigna angularis var. angularis]|nr:hypothetical protein VIGAN_01301500 [Vigna angularis var. angularis]
MAASHGVVAVTGYHRRRPPSFSVPPDRVGSFLSFITGPSMANTAGSFTSRHYRRHHPPPEMPLIRVSFKTGLGFWSIVLISGCLL